MKKYFVILSIIFGALFLDQLSKGLLLYLITDTVPWAGHAWDIVPVPYMMANVFDFFNVVFTWNFGTSFSMFRTLGEATPFIMIVATGAIIGALMYYLFKRAKKYEVAPLALVCGGALGNLVDRIRFGAVVDFLDFHIGGWHWPAFNIADVCIVLGVAWYLLSVYLARQKCIKSIKDGK
ncbi:MAG: signal peptidase II [Alphaproteobacteria bacterium]